MKINIHRPYLTINQIVLLKSTGIIKEIDCFTIEYEGILKPEIIDHGYMLYAKSESGRDYIIESIDDYYTIEDLIY